MKRFLLTFVFAVCVFACCHAVKAQACVAPLEYASDSDVMLYKTDDIAMQYCKLEIRPTAAGYFAVTAEIAVKNNGDDANVTFGIPYYFYNGLSQVSSLAVNYKGSTSKVTKLNAVKNEELGDTAPFYSSYYCWNADIKSGETAYMYITFTVSQRNYENNTMCIDIPLDVLKYWSNKSGSARIIIDSAAVNIYSYDRNPSIVPSFVYSDGKLVWKNDISIYNGNLTVYHNVDYSVIYKFFSNIYTSGPQKEAAELFRTRQYDAAISFIDENVLTEDINFVFMKMVCYENLGLESSANEILKTIYDKNVCFSADNKYDISEYVKKRMLYMYYSSIDGKTEELLEAKKNILKTGIESLSESKSSVFMTWAKEELNSLEGESSGNNNNNNNNNNQETGDPTQKSWLKEISEPVIITVGIVMIVVVIFCLTGMFSGMNKNKKIKARNVKR